MRRGITELHGIFQQFIGHVADRTLELGLAFGRRTIVAGEERTEVIGEKIGREPIVAPALLNGQRGRRKADLEILALIVFACNEMAECPSHISLAAWLPPNA